MFPCQTKPRPEFRMALEPMLREVKKHILTLKHRYTLRTTAKTLAIGRCVNTTTL